MSHDSLFISNSQNVNLLGDFLEFLHFIIQELVQPMGSYASRLLKPQKCQKDLPGKEYCFMHVIQWLISGKGWFEVTIPLKSQSTWDNKSQTNPDWHEQWKKIWRMCFFSYPVWLDRDFVMKSFPPTIRESDPTGMERNLCGSRRFPEKSAHAIWSNYTSHDRFPPNGGDVVRENPRRFQRREGWWNIIPFDQNI